jgi:hypothetical protein
VPLHFRLDIDPELVILLELGRDTAH